MKIQTVILFLAIFFNCVGISAESYPPLTEAERTSYYSKLNAEIQKQGEVIKEIIQTAANGDQVYFSLDAELEHAKGMMEVKRTLVANFVETPSIRSAKVRDQLLAILRKETVSVADLTSLQMLVNEEKPKVLQEDAKALKQSLSEPSGSE